jgi:hypothetical protein
VSALRSVLGPEIRLWSSTVGKGTTFYVSMIRKFKREVWEAGLRRHEFQTPSAPSGRFPARRYCLKSNPGYPHVGSSAEKPPHAGDPCCLCGRGILLQWVVRSDRKRQSEYEHTIALMTG